MRRSIGQQGFIRAEDEDNAVDGNNGHGQINFRPMNRNHFHCRLDVEVPPLVSIKGNGN